VAAGDGELVSVLADDLEVGYWLSHFLLLLRRGGGAYLTTTYT